MNKQSDHLENDNSTIASTNQTTQLSLESDPFYFESDTLALRNNPDYSCLLKTIILLEAQRIKACQDLERLIDIKEQAMQDPIRFIQNLRFLNTSSNLDLPTRQKVYVLPEIEWNKYYDCVDLEDLEAIKNQKINRVQSLRQTSKLIQAAQAEADSVTEAKPTRNSAHRAINSNQTGQETIQGSSSRNYNKPWSVEEQRCLEELLIEFPPEDNESARWRKIATKLGTRTPLQVQSHCQKYFIKLAKAGLPIPGRMPNMKTYVTKKGTRGNRKSSLMRAACHSSIGGGRGRIIGSDGRNVTNGKRMVGRGSSLNEISSMWTSFNPPITMNDENELDNEFGHDCEENDIQSNRNFEDNEGESSNNNIYENDEECNQEYDDEEGMDEETTGDSNNNYISSENRNENFNNYKCEFF